jgi:hypothetical protein
MMRFVACVACLSVAVGCFGRAVGEAHDSLLSADYLWVNWALMAVWIFNAAMIAFKGTDW